MTNDLLKIYLQRCFKLGEIAQSSGNSPVGSIIVFEDAIIGEGIEAGKSSGDITNHAEILAVKDAIAKGNLNNLCKSTMYSSHEPCIMCSYVIRHYRIPHIVYSISVDYVGGHTSNFNILSAEAVPKWSNKPLIEGNILL